MWLVLPGTVGSKNRNCISAAGALRSLLDPAPAKGAFKAVPAHFFDTVLDSYQVLRRQGYQLFTLEPTGGTPLYEYSLPTYSAFVFGHEEVGLSLERSDFPDIQVLTIPHGGAVESLNVSVAASIVMYECACRRRIEI